MRTTPPYLPFLRFLQSLDSIAISIPPRIDRGSWGVESPYLGTLLWGAYRFFRLVDVEGRPTDLLHRLATDPASRSATLREILQSAYGEVLTMVTSAEAEAEVEQALGRFRLSGATHRKALSFLVQACRYAGVALPGFLTEKARASHAKNVRRPAEGGVQMTAINVTLRSGGEITLAGQFDPFAISPDDRTFVFKIIDELRGYDAKHGEPEEEARPEEHEHVF
jgi:hypothetical protein